MEVAVLKLVISEEKSEVPSFLHTVGAEGKVADKIQCLKDIIKRPEGYFRVDSIGQVTDDEFVTFTQKVQEYENAGINFFGTHGKQGSLLCDKTFREYRAIKNEEKRLSEDIDDTTSYAAVLRYLLAPIRNLPRVEELDALERDGGKRKFSKMILNYAVKLVLERISFVKGYCKRRELEIPSLPLRGITD